MDLKTGYKGSYYVFKSTSRLLCTRHASDGLCMNVPSAFYPERLGNIIFLCGRSIIQVICGRLMSTNVTQPTRYALESDKIIH